MRAGERGLSTETLLSAILSDPNGEKFKGQNTNSTDEKITGGEDENHISTDANHKLPGDPKDGKTRRGYISVQAKFQRRWEETKIKEWMDGNRRTQGLVGGAENESFCL